ncbi:MAG TPA: hypothetical protein VGM51_05315 [Armatimonadota bacterium]
MISLRAAQKADYESGLILMGNRHYDPAIGRFICQDAARTGRRLLEVGGETKRLPTSNITLLTSDLGKRSGNGPLPRLALT